MDTFGKFIGDLFKHFPLFTVVALFLAVYALWRATGGIERGEARRAAGNEGLFIKVNGVPDAFEEHELFGVQPAEQLESQE